MGAQHCLLLIEVLVGEQLQDSSSRHGRFATRLQKDGKKDCLGGTSGGRPLLPGLEPASFSTLGEEHGGPDGHFTSSEEGPCVQLSPGPIQKRSGTERCEFGGYTFHVESRVYAWGSNARQQLGIPHGSERAAQFRTGSVIDPGQPTPLNTSSRVASSPGTPETECPHKADRRSAGKDLAKSTRQVTPEELDQVCSYRPLLLSQWVSAPCRRTSLSCGAGTAHSQSVVFPEWAVGISSEGKAMGCECRKTASGRRGSCFSDTFPCSSASVAEGAARLAPLYEPFFCFSCKVTAVAAGSHHSLLLGENGKDETVSANCSSARLKKRVRRHADVFTSTLPSFFSFSG